MNLARDVQVPAMFRIMNWPALILLILIATPFEMGASADKAFLLRVVFAALFLALFMLSTRFAVSQMALLTTLAICTYFTFVNLLDVTNYVFLSLIMIAFGLIVAALSVGDEKNRRALLWLLSAYLYFHLAGFAIVGAAFITTGYVLDLHQVLFPFSESRAGVFLGFARLTGFHIEPGSYSNWMFLVVVLRGLLMNRIGTRLHWVVIGSTIFTFSAWAALAAAVFATACFLEYLFRANTNVKFKWTVVSAIFVAGLMALPVAIDYAVNSQFWAYLATRMTIVDGASSSANYKVVAFTQLIEQISQGIGLGAPMAQQFCASSDCISPQDLGVGLNAAYYFGVAPLTLFVVWAGGRLALERGVAFVVLLLPVFLSKAHFYDPLIWLIVGVMLFDRRGIQSRSPNRQRGTTLPRLAETSRGL